MVTQKEINQAMLDKLSQISQNKPKNDIGNDQILKFFTGLCTVAVIWLFTELNTAGRNILELKTKMTILENTVKKHDTLLDDPRFTKPQAVELINASVNPLSYKVNEVDIKLKSRGDWMGSTEKRITKLESDFQIIQENLEDIKYLIKNK